MAESKVQKFYYTYDQMVLDLERFYQSKEGQMFRVDYAVKKPIMLALSRGGLVLTQYLGYLYDIRDVVAIPSLGYEDTQDTEKRIILYSDQFRKIVRDRHLLIVDDIYDSGRSVNAVLEELATFSSYGIFTIFSSDPNATQYYLRKHNGEWVEFPWDIDVRRIKRGGGLG